MNKKQTQARVIAFYLPQYHPTPDNDLWWGKGFTEWTNVCRARKRFLGHEQPKIPADLGFYDLRLPEIREAQAQMAAENGIEGFCYYHYYFGNGKMELEYPFAEVLASGKPDFPFCLAWANESWYAKSWNINGISGKKLLIEQTYESEADYRTHFEIVLPAFRDRRYICVDGKPIFMIYRPRKFPDVANFMKSWRRWAMENGLPGIFFVAQSANMAREAGHYLAQGFDAINSIRLHDYDQNMFWMKKLFQLAGNKLFHLPKIVSYPKAARKFIAPEDYRETVFPSIITGWDHTPRSGRNGSVMINYTPEVFGLHIEDVLRAMVGKTAERRIVFLKSWNEWGEGNFIEPDLKYGHRFLDVLKHHIV